MHIHFIFNMFILKIKIQFLIKEYVEVIFILFLVILSKGNLDSIISDTFANLPKKNS